MKETTVRIASAIPPAGWASDVSRAVPRQDDPLGHDPLRRDALEPAVGGGDALARRAALYDAFLGRVEQASEVAEFVAERVGALTLPATSSTSAPRLLDMGCGTGRLFAPLAERGFSVEGHEPDPAYFAAARARAGRLTGAATVRRGGFDELDAQAAFEVVVAVNGVFSYLQTEDARRAALARMSRALVEGGLVLIDVPDFAHIVGHYRPPVPEERLIDGVAVLRTYRHSVDLLSRQWVHEETLQAPSEQTTTCETVRLAMIRADELVELLRQAGFSEVSLWTGYRPPAASVATPRIIATARRVGRRVARCVAGFVERAGEESTP